MNFYAMTGSGRGPDGGSSSSSSSSSSTSSFSNHSHLPDVFCELCFAEVEDAVPIQNVAEGNMMTKIMKNFSHHMQFPSGGVTTLPGEIVPLCGECLQVIKTLWDLQCLIEKAVNNMERIVVDSEILFPNKEPKNPGSNGYVLRLREMILEGYRAKLQKNQQERNNQALGLVKFDNHNHQQQVHNPVVHVDDSSFDDDGEGEGEIRGSTSTSDAIRALLSSIRNEFSEEDDDDEYQGDKDESLNSNDDDGSQDEGEEIYMEEANGFGYHGPQTQKEEVDDGQRTSVQAQRRVDYEEQEKPLLPNDDEFDGNQGEGAEEEDEDDDVFIIERNKSPLLIKGVEVYECTTGSKPGVRYLQCGSCNFKLSIPDPEGATESGLAEVRMKSHVQSWHKRANKAAKVRKIGNARTTTTRSRKPTSERRTVVPSIECDRKNQQERNNQALDLVGFDNYNPQQRHNPDGQPLLNSAACANVNPPGFGAAHQLPTTARDNDNDGDDDDSEREIYIRGRRPSTRSTTSSAPPRALSDSKAVGYLERHKQEDELGMNGDGSEQVQEGYDDDDDEDKETDVEAEDDGDAFEIKRNESPLIIDGVKVFKCTNGSKPDVRYLQCGSCNLYILVDVGDVRTALAVAESQMKGHIRFMHEKMKKLSSAKACKKVDLRSPKTIFGKRSRSVPSIECDICLRPLPASRPQNLLLHKFTHMNEAEQQKTLATRGKDKSCYNFLTRKRRTEGNIKGTTGETGTPAAKKSRRISAKTKWVRKDGGADKAASELKFPCPFCSRSFKGKSYLTRHLKTHGKLMRQPPPAPQQNLRFERGSKEEFLYSLGLVCVQKKPEQN